MKIVDEDDVNYWEIKVNYYPQIDIRKGHKESLYYVDSSKYNLEDIDSLFQYLQDAEEMYNYADNSYIYDGVNYSNEYDEDSYINYHFENIPEKFFSDDNFALRFFEESDQWSYGTNIFRSNNSVYFDVKSIETVMVIINQINHHFDVFFNIMSLNGVALIDVINEYNEEDYLDIRSIDSLWIDLDWYIDLFNKYKINKLKEKLDNKYAVKNTTEKRNKI